MVKVCLNQVSIVYRTQVKSAQELDHVWGQRRSPGDDSSARTSSTVSTSARLKYTDEAAGKVTAGRDRGTVLEPFFLTSALKLVSFTPGTLIPGKKTQCDY